MALMKNEVKRKVLAPSELGKEDSGHGWRGAFSAAGLTAISESDSRNKVFGPSSSPTSARSANVWGHPALGGVADCALIRLSLGRPKIDTLFSSLPTWYF